MIFRNCLLAASNAQLAQRTAIAPLCQFRTLPMRCRAPQLALSITLVVDGHRISLPGRFIALMANISSSPSRRLAAEEGWLRSYHLDILIIYIDAICLGDYHILGAIGVDSTGSKHVLGLREGSSENSVVATELLNDLVERGVKPDRHRLFVIDGAKALRNAIDAVYGSANPVQRCRIHKLRNVIGHLPKDQHRNARSTLCAAWKMDDVHEGKQQIEQLAR